MHRLLMTSGKAYRMSSQFSDEGNLQRDPENKFQWRFRARRREELEIVRDSILAASGSLNRELGGPPVFRRSRKKSWHRSATVSGANIPMVLKFGGEAFTYIANAGFPSECGVVRPAGSKHLLWRSQRLHGSNPGIDAFERRVWDQAGWLVCGESP